MLLLLSFLPLAVPFFCVNASPTIQLGKTTLVGLEIPTFQQEFFGGSSVFSVPCHGLWRRQGIPYAEPPLGSLRLNQPVLKSSLDSHTFNATSYGPACLQNVRTRSPQAFPSLILSPISGSSARPNVGGLFNDKRASACRDLC
jgi:hypothetical protein